MLFSSISLPSDLCQLFFQPNWLWLLLLHGSSLSPSLPLLATCSSSGHSIHLYSLLPPSPAGRRGRDKARWEVVRVLILVRGATRAEVVQVAFSEDGRWLAAATLRGTTRDRERVCVGGIRLVWGSCLLRFFSVGGWGVCVCVCEFLCSFSSYTIPFPPLSSL